MGSVPSTDNSVGRTIVTRGLTGVLKRCVQGSSRGITLPPESHGGTNMDSVMPPPSDAGDNMMCDPSNPLLTVNGIMSKTQANVKDSINTDPGDKEEISFPETSSNNEFVSKYGILQTDFTNYASFLLNSWAGGGRENNISDNLKFSLSTIVQFLQQQLEKLTEATFLELTKSKEVHEAEKAQLIIDCEEKVNEVLMVSEANIQELNCRLEEVSKQYSATQFQLRATENTLITSQLELQNLKEIVQKMQDERDEKMTQIRKLNMSQDVNHREMIAMKVDLETKLRHSQDAAKASDQQVQELQSSIQEKERVVEEWKLETSQLKSKCQKAEAQLAQIEQKAANESLTSGSYADDHANPSMLQDACKSVDKATDNLIRVLHGRSITSSPSAKLQDHLQRFLGQISPASLANFSRPVQVKYAWGHWICFTLFHGFEHVFFDMDGVNRTSPLDFKSHSLNCFQSYQQKKHIASLKLYEGCDMFRAFCIRKYSKLFPLGLVQQALQPQSAYNIICDSYGRFNDDSEIYHHFLDVAKAIWLLHELSFSFDPPASVLRMAAGLPFDKQYHESVIHDADNNGMPQAVLLMIRPAFRLRNSIIQSRVFLSTSGRVDISKTPEEQQAELRMSSIVTAFINSV